MRYLENFERLHFWYALQRINFHKQTTNTQECRHYSPEQVIPWMKLNYSCELIRHEESNSSLTDHEN